MWPAGTSPRVNQFATKYRAAHLDRTLILRCGCRAGEPPPGHDVERHREAVLAWCARWEREPVVAPAAREGRRG